MMHGHVVLTDGYVLLAILAGCAAVTCVINLICEWRMR